MSGVGQAFASGRSGRSGVYDPSGLNVLRFARQRLAVGEHAAFATLAGIDGTSPRRIGEQMAVAVDGAFEGSISTGCLEPALAHEAASRIARKQGGVARYGKGSPFIDIKLPCGSGVDIFFSIVSDADAVGRAIDRLCARRPASLAFSADGVVIDDGEKTGWRGEQFIRAFAPPLRIIAAGAGAELSALGRLALAAGMEFRAFTNDDATLDDWGEATTRLASPHATPDIEFDPWTAFVSFFHGADWETSTLSAALRSDAFYIGAVGSPAHQKLRREALAEDGADAQSIARLRGPIGLIPSTRDPSSLAISVLADIVASAPARP